MLASMSVGGTGGAPLDEKSTSNSKEGLSPGKAMVAFYEQVLLLLRCFCSGDGSGFRVDGDNPFHTPFLVLYMELIMNLSTILLHR